MVEAPDGVRLVVHTLADPPVTGGSAVLCIPGGPGRASEYLGDLGGLVADRPFHRLDMRGTGLSDLPDDPQTLAFPRLGDDVETVRMALGIDRLTDRKSVV